MKLFLRILSVGLLVSGVATPAVRAELTPDAPFPLWHDAESVESDSDLERLSRAFVRLADKVRPAVVQVRVGYGDAAESEPDPRRARSSRGSGFIIHPRGYILTAHHVVERSGELEVRLADTQRVPARIIAADPQTDVALIKIDGDRDFPTLRLANSDILQVGQLAVGFGYPFGRESSMSVGIVSRPGRSYRDSASYDLIQTDAGANAGGSGGPLLNSKGDVVGMITMASERGNIGFAVPINVIKGIVPRLLRGEKMRWGWLGVRVSEVSLELASHLGLVPVKGVLVSSVLPGQPAERGGILPQDIILSVNDTQVDSPREVIRLIGGLEAGKAVKLTILRKGETMELSVPLGAKPRTPEGREG